MLYYEFGMRNGCHPERSEGSFLSMEMLRSAQHDTAHSAFIIPHLGIVWQSA